MKKITHFIAVMAITFTQAQVSLVQDFNIGIGDGMPTFNSNRLSFNGNLIFSAYNGSSYYVWVIDNSSTQPTLEVNFPDPSLTPQYFTYSSSNNKVYFTGQSATNGISTLWEYRTSNSTSLPSNTAVKEIKYITELQDKVYYQCVANTSIGYELYFTDSNSTGNLNLNNTGSSFPEEITAIGNKLYFSAIPSASNGRQLFIYSSTNNSITEYNINLSGDSNPKNFISFNNLVYFTANNGINGRELWVTDGTVGGAEMVLDLNSGTTGSNPENLTVYNNALYFTATHPTLGTEIFKMNTTQNITLLKNIANSSNSSLPTDLIVYDNKLYFSADDNINGRELWSSTGFSSTTNMLKDINTSPATPDTNPTGFTPYFGELYFSADDGINGRELWKTDGTALGTVLVSDINVSGDSNPEDLVVAGNNLFFSATTPTTGKELFRYINPSLSVTDLELNQTFSIFPNPTNNSFSIESTSTITELSIHDIQGKLIKRFSVNQERYNIENLTSGLYFLKIRSNLGEVTKKLIKN